MTASQKKHCSTRNRENSANGDQLDNTVYHWFIKKHTQGITVSKKKTPQEWTENSMVKPVLANER